LFLIGDDKMKKRVFISFLLALSFLTAEAKAGFGVRSGFSYASLTQILDDQVTYGGRIGFSVAGLLDIPVSSKFSLRPEIALMSQGGTYWLEYMPDNQWRFVREKHRSIYYSIQAPINIAYKINVGDWQFGACGGPFVSLSTRFREKGALNERNFRPFDIGAGVGLYVQRQHIFCSIYSQTGFLDRLTRKQPGESQLYQNNVTLSFGYWF